MIEVYDAHCHYTAARNSTDQHIAIASIQLNDIHDLITLRHNKPLAKIGAGLHPWYINQFSDITQLRAQLEQ